LDKFDYDPVTRKIIYKDYSYYQDWLRILCFYVEIEKKENYPEIEQWIIENLDKKWGRHYSSDIKFFTHMTYYFEDYKDAVAFRLRWG